MIRRAIFTTILTGAAIGIMAQNAPTGAATTPASLAGMKPDQYDTIFLSTKLGSFRFIDGVGKIEISFTGSLLLSKFEGKKTFTGNLRQEFPRNEADKKMGREVWFGTGKVVLDGKFRAVQWFGRDLSGSWEGAGIVRMYGEFDRDLNTGTYFFKSNPKKLFWNPFGTQTPLPPYRQAGANKPTIRRSGGGR